MLTAELKTYRDALIEQLTSHAPATIEANVGDWATDRLNAIRDIEWDLAEQGAEFEPFVLAHYLITGKV
jgi:hypothetical protein